LDFDIEVGQSKTLGSQLIEPGRSGAANDSTAIESGLPPTEVIQKDKDNIRFVLCQCDGTRKTEKEHGND
jgi:hypothetical protein